MGWIAGPESACAGSSERLSSALLGRDELVEEGAEPEPGRE